MPKAFGAKYHYQDHDSDVVDETPPVQNQWYTVFDAHDVRLLLCGIYQSNDETAVKNISVRWTIDGNVYYVLTAHAHGAWGYLYRTLVPSGGGTAGLAVVAALVNATYYEDKRGINFKVEVRMTSVPGTNQRLLCRCVRETLELT